MTTVIHILAIIGALTVSFPILVVMCEFIRAFRQGNRVAVITTRHLFDRQPSLKERLKAFQCEILRGYDTLVIGNIEIPHNPNEPIRGRRY